MRSLFCSSSTVLSSSSIASRRASRQCATRSILRTRRFGSAQASTLEDGSQSGPSPNVLELLSERGYIKDFAGNRDVLRRLLQQRSVGFYAGVDPTARSLHLGHLIPLMVLFWLFVHGHLSVSLIGGATAQIGDPTGRLTSRATTAPSTNIANSTALTRQVQELWANAVEYGARHGYKRSQHGKMKLLDNKEWLLRLNVVDFLRMLGTNMRVGAMLGRDTVKNKMEKGDGMSFAEFSYPLLQAWDWWHMYKKYGVQVQVGGSDQFGNIIAGLEAVKSVAQATQRESEDSWERSHTLFGDDSMPMGLTTPLLTTSSGRKFGKSAGNAVWLDHDMTSPYDLYGFLLRTADADVERYLQLLTFVPLDVITDIMKQHELDPSVRIAQHLLASEVLELVHGRDVALDARRSHERLRKAALASGSSTAASALSTAERTFLPRSLMASASFSQLLYHAGLSPTRSAGTRLIKAGGAYVAGSYDPSSLDATLAFKPIGDLQPTDCISFKKDSTVIIRLGKWKVRVLEAVDDEHDDPHRPRGSQVAGTED